MNQATTAATRRQSDTFLRGIAICCVVLIHFLSSFKKSPFITGAEFQNVAVAIDQLGRVAVPLFVALSGYGLMLRYQKTELKWSEFLKKRVFINGIKIRINFFRKSIKPSQYGRP